MMKELTAKALSLAYMGRMPMTAAATSMSRMAIHSRPMALRTRFLASKAITTKMLRHNQYLVKGVSMGKPNTCKPAAETEPEGESLVSHLMRKNIQSEKNCAASVATARYRPLTRSEGRPNKMPKAVAHSPPSKSAGIRGMPSMRTKKL